MPRGARPDSGSCASGGSCGVYAVTRGVYRCDNVEIVESRGNIRITVDTTGVYTLDFDNSFSVLTAKTVDLTYSVVPRGDL